MINLPHEHLELEVVVPQDGYMFIYLVNESREDTDVYFDDFSISHIGVDILKTTDFYPFGLALKNWQKEDYRFGYQGQFAELDEETGWSSFELRMYDPIVARWVSTDPYGQFASPYLGMGNNPVNGVDPDGGVTGFLSDMVLSGVTIRAGLSAGTKTVIGATLSGLGSVFAASPDNIYRRNSDGSLTLIEKTDDDFDLVYNEDGTIEAQYLHSVSVSADLKGDLLAAARNPLVQSMRRTYDAFWENDVTVATTAVLTSMIGVGVLSRLAKPVSRLSTPLKTASPNTLGKIGEASVSALKKTKTRIPSLTRTAKYRIPDGLTSKTVLEVKNVSKLSYTKQLRDLHKYAKATGRGLEIYMSNNTQVSKTLQDLINSGDIIRKSIGF